MRLLIRQIMKKKIIVVGCLLFCAMILSGCAVKNMTCGLKDANTNLSYADALKIAKASDCLKEGLTTKISCNENTGTWWIDLKTKKEGCSPACVIDVKNKTAEVNWRCTGLKN